MPIYMKQPAVLFVREAALDTGNGLIVIGPKHDDPVPPPQGGFGGLVVLNHNTQK